MSEQEIAAAMAGAEIVGEDKDVDPKSCPVTSLGTEGGNYYFLKPSGELRVLRDRDLKGEPLVGLFGGSKFWLIKNFQRRDREGELIQDYNARSASAWLMRECEKAGLYDPSGRMRGPGVWPGVDGLAVAVHCGDGFWHGGEWRRPGRVGDVVYNARPRLVRPDFERPATVKDGERIRATLDHWNFARPSDRALTVGFFGLMALGAAPSWRAHLLVSALHGAGKTWLANYAAALLGPQASSYNNFTEAGLRQSLSSEARAIILDEAEDDRENAGRMGQVIGMIRRMSGGSGARAVRGSTGGDALTFDLAGAVMLCAIHPPPLMPQDRSRIHRVELRQLAGGADAAERVLAETEWARQISPAFRARMVMAWPRFVGAVSVFRSSLIKHGCTARQADLFASLLAGRDLILEDHAPDADSADALVVQLSASIADLVDDDNEENDAQRCWAMLLTSQLPGLFRDGAAPVVSSMLLDMLHPATEGNGRQMDAERALAMHGMRVLSRSEGGPALLVANRHNGLSRIFRGSDWDNEQWRVSLGRLPGAGQHGDSIRFAGFKSRCTRIPEAHLPTRDD